MKSGVEVRTSNHRATAASGRDRLPELLANAELSVTTPGSLSPSVRAQPSSPVRIFEEDQSLRYLLAAVSRAPAEAASRVLAPGWELERGRWDPDSNPIRDPSSRLLILEGLFLAQVQVCGRVSAELLGAGDLFGSAEPEAEGDPTVASSRTWRVLEPGRIAVLDSQLLGKLASVPAVATDLYARTERRFRSLNIRLAIAQEPRLAMRLHLLFWHLADRWGRSSADGVVIPLTLSHEVLASCVSAHRTSVVAALGRLQQAGAVQRCSNGHWLLHEAPSAAPV